MKILAIGDIVGTRAVEYLSKNLWKMRDALGVDLVVANGENASEIHGVSASDASAILDAGVDLITLGNHTFGRKDLFSMLSDSENIIRPANYPPLAPGGGYTTLNVEGYKILCINILGTALMEPLACPFATVDKILEREAGEYDLALMDIHAEATSEKIALARYFDGRINVMFGTHTHVQTADECILKGGTGYISDLGMCGPEESVLGVDKDIIIKKFRTNLPCRFDTADDRDCMLNGCIFSVDEKTGRCTDIERINLR